MPRPGELRTHQSRHLEQWYHDPLSCLHTTIASVLLANDVDPLQVLGRRLGFAHLPGQVTNEEFYYPSTSPDGLVADLAPFHKITSRWWRPDEDDVVGALHQALIEDELLIAAVDNFHLPHRPAFHDVHAAHLVVIDGLDEGRGTISISDAQPPAWRGHIELAPFLKAWSSENPADDQDAFFSARDIEFRCLRVDVEPGIAPMTLEELHETIRVNLEELVADGDATALDVAPDAEQASGALTGIWGLSRYLDELVENAGDPESPALAELYALAWPLQAQAFLHGELLAASALEWGEAPLAILGRASASVASAWTNLRVLGAHLATRPGEQGPQLRRRAGQLRQAYEEVAYLYGRYLDDDGRTL